MNFVLILTDTQNLSLLGAYGNPAVDTPNLDRLAGEGIRFNRAYTSCPLCTPARAAIFSAQHPQLAGAWCNNIAPYRHVPLMGEIVRQYGYRAGYTGKWHLDGTSYFGDGQPGGGFEGNWWYDGKCYAEDIGPEMFDAYRHKACTSEQLRKHGFTEQNIWGHRVADRAIDFLQTVGEDFLLVVSFDEPHGPFVTPPEYLEETDPANILSRPDNFNAPLDDKPQLQQIHRRSIGEVSWEEYIRSGMPRRWLACNRYIDREIGRVIDAVDRLHGEDTTIIYTSDHGDQFRAHGLTGKGPMMYEETTHIPLLIRTPDGPRRAVSESVVSHVDLLPTMLEGMGADVPPMLNGVSLRPVLEDPAATVRDHALINWHRFAINHDDWGEFFPIRCVTDGRHKLAVNLFDTDELYDLVEDPGEMRNAIDDPHYTDVRNALHDALLEEMDRMRDPYRQWRWGSREWRQVRQPFYRGGQRRNRPEGFPWQPGSIDAH